MTGMLAYIPLAGSWLQESLRGGDQIGSATLVNFYALHPTVLPILFVIFMPWHFRRVRKVVGMVYPHGEGKEARESPDRVHTIPHLVTKELAVALTLVAVMLDELLIDFQPWLPGIPPEIHTGLIPLAFVMTAIVGFYLLMKRRFEATRAEAIQTIFVFLFTAFVVLTIIGVWFRGEGMALILLGS